MNLKNKNAFYVIAILVLSFIVITEPIAANTKFKPVDLGTLEYDESAALAINDLDQIVGTCKREGTSYVFLWDQESEIVLLNMPLSAIPKALNNKNQISGNYIENNFERGFFHDLTGFHDIGTLGGSRTWVTDMNSKGQIVGYSETGKMSSLRNGKKEIHAFVWHKGVMKDLGALNKDVDICGDESAATGISNQGDIIGYSNHALIHKGKALPSVLKAVIWKNEQIAELFPKSLPSFHSQAFCISRNGTIAAFRQTGPIFFEGIVLDTLNYYPCQFSTTSGGSPIWSVKINDNGLIILSHSGHCSVSEKQFNLQSARYEGADIIPSNFYWASYETLNGINNANKIVGTARSIYGERHAVLLIPE